MNFINPYKKGTLIYNLYALTKNIGLDYLSETHLIDCILSTRCYEFIEQYIDEYLNLYPEKINIFYNGLTPLMIASISTNNYTTEKTVEILLKHGADPNIQNELGYTALMESVILTKTESTENTIKILIEYGTNLEIQDCQGMTAIMLSAGSLSTQSTIQTFLMLLETKQNLNIVDNNNHNVLFILIRSVDKETAEFLVPKLLELGVNPNVKSKLGWNALDVAKAHSSEKVVKILENKFFT